MRVFDSPRARRTDSDWSAYTEYGCQNCSLRCINRLDSKPAKLRLCHVCLQNPANMRDLKPPTEGNRFA